MTTTRLTSDGVTEATLTTHEMAVTNPAHHALSQCRPTTGANTGARVQGVQAEGGCVR
jgi:hypothetical protein